MKVCNITYFIPGKYQFKFEFELFIDIVDTYYITYSVSQAGKIICG